MSRILALIVLVACSAEEPAPVDMATELACTELCDARDTCDSSPSDSCVGECVADVGFPGDPCAAALSALADCIAANCDDAACADELGERDATCGGTG